MMYSIVFDKRSSVFSEAVNMGKSLFWEAGGRGGTSQHTLHKGVQKKENDSHVPWAVVSRSYECSFTCEVLHVTRAL